jgi:plasmid stabilization system protein ParE
MTTASIAVHPVAGSGEPENRGPSRAELLARRIEEGADLLAAFAIGLSNDEWRTPISESDRRTVGVIVHHVASVYPVEVDLAKKIAQGKRLRT